ncbi:MAG TPA: tetratricopeptide repeat protein [Micropepsaceae bacterium]|nr:tetratricopeptide repeat protein [Micropepsaceae bacterium]
MKTGAAGRIDDAYKRGLKLAHEGRHAEAIEAFERALARRPNDARVLFALGNTAEAVGHRDAAETFFRRVLAQEPDRLEVLVNLGNLLRAGNRTADAVALLKPALERNPAEPSLWLTLGSALNEAGDAKTAEIFYREALRLSPGYALAQGNLADLLFDRGATDDALAMYDEVVRNEPENAQARLNRAVLLLVTGDLKRGWDDYEYRLAVKGRALHRDHGLPQWDGSTKENLHLLVEAEQGVGDQLAFVSLIPELAENLAHQGGRVILEAEPRLVPLFARSFPQIRVHASDIETRGGRKLAHYPWLGTEGGADCAVAMGSLPRFLRAKIEDFPKPHAYLVPSEERVIWARWLEAQGKPPYVGLCWRSGLMGGTRNIQYAPLEAWGTFLRDVPGTLVSLQYDGRTEEISALEHMSGRKIFVPPNLDQKQEIDRTASFIAALDAVASAPTAVSWIAAGLGVPTLKLLYKTSWMALGTDYEPFAPACRCIMPEDGGDWATTFSKAAGALHAMQFQE